MRWIIIFLYFFTFIYIYIYICVYVRSVFVYVCVCVCVCIYIYIYIYKTTHLKTYLYVNISYSYMLFCLFFFLDNTGYSQEALPSRVREDIVTLGGRMNGDAANDAVDDSTDFFISTPDFSDLSPLKASTPKHKTSYYNKKGEYSNNFFS